MFIKKYSSEFRVRSSEQNLKPGRFSYSERSLPPKTPIGGTPNLLLQKLFLGRRRPRPAEIFIGQARCLPAPGGPVEKPLLDQKRFIHIFEGVLFFVERGRKRIEPNRSALELVDNCQQQLPVHVIKPFFIHLESFHGTCHKGGSNDAVTLHLSKVPHPPEQAVGYARSPPGTAGYLGSRRRLDGCMQQFRGANHDPGELAGVVKAQTVYHAEAVPKRRGEEPRPGRGPHEGKVRQIELDRAGARPLPDDDIELEILHGRIEDLLDDAAQAVDLIDEQYVTVLQIGQDGGQVPRALEHRARCRLDADPELMGDDVGKRGLAEPRRSAEQHMVERFSPAPGRLDEDAKVVLDPVLSHEIIEVERPQAPVELNLVVILFRGYDSLCHGSFRDLRLNERRWTIVRFAHGDDGRKSFLRHSSLYLFIRSESASLISAS